MDIMFTTCHYNHECHNNYYVNNAIQVIIIIIVDEEWGELPNLHLGIQTSHHSYKCANFTTEHCSDTFIKEDCKHINDSAGI